MLVCGGRDQRFWGLQGFYKYSGMPSLPHCQGVGTEKPRALFNQANWFELAVVENLGMGDRQTSNQSLHQSLPMGLATVAFIPWIQVTALKGKKNKNDLQVSKSEFSFLFPFRLEGDASHLVVKKDAVGDSYCPVLHPGPHVKTGCSEQHAWWGFNNAWYWMSAACGEGVI